MKGQSFEEHLLNLQNVFERLRTAGLKLKCAFLKKEGLYLGHLVSREGVFTDPTKVGKVAGWPEPTSTEEVQQFLGFASYYQRFIRDFSQIAKPLHRLTERNCRFKWTPEYQCSIEELKYKLTTAPVLANPDFSKPFIPSPTRRTQLLPSSLPMKCSYNFRHQNNSAVTKVANLSRDCWPK